MQTTGTTFHFGTARFLLSVLIGASLIRIGIAYANRSLLRAFGKASVSPSNT